MSGEQRLSGPAVSEETDVEDPLAKLAQPLPPQEMPIEREAPPSDDMADDAFLIQLSGMRYLAHPLRRLLALTLDLGLALGFALALSLLQWPPFVPLLQTINQDLWAFVPWPASLLPSQIAGYPLAVWPLIEFPLYFLLCALLFERTIGQQIFELTHLPQLHPVPARIKSFARMAIGLIFAPLILADAPVLLKRPTLKERLTQFYIVYLPPALREHLNPKELAPAVIRLLALTGDLTLANLLHVFILREQDLYTQSLNQFLVGPLTTLVDQYQLVFLARESELVARVLLDLDLIALPLYVGMGMLSSLCFGVTPGQLVLGLQSEGNFFTARLAGLSRFLLGVLLAPLLVADLPCLIRKRTFKEWLFRSRLVLTVKRK